MSTRAYPVLVLAFTLAGPACGTTPRGSADGGAPGGEPASPPAAAPAPQAEAPVPTPPRIDPRAALAAGVKARKAGHLGEAVLRFREAAEEAPTWTLARLELAQALLRTGGHPEEVRQHLDVVAGQEPGNPRLLYLTGLLHEELQEPQAAMEAYLAALEPRPSLMDARLRLGRLLLDAARYAAAVSHLEAAVAQEPANLAARSNLADAYERMGRPAAAEAELLAMVRLYPDNPFHLTRLARFYDRHGREAEAAAAQARADAIRPPRERRDLRPLPKSRR